jgi:hypothetical protein
VLCGQRDCYDETGSETQMKSNLGIRHEGKSAVELAKDLMRTVSRAAYALAKDVWSFASRGGRLFWEQYLWQVPTLCRWHSLSMQQRNHGS